MGVPKIKKMVRLHITLTYLGYFIIRRLKLTMISMCTKFQVPYFTLFKVREGPKKAKIQKRLLDLEELRLMM